MYFEDYKVGMVFDKEIEPIKFTEEEIIEYGKKFDPRDFHIDKKAAEKSMFARIIAPGSFSNMAFWGQWVKTGIDKEGGICGLGLEYANWYRPVFADTLYKIKVEIIGKEVRKENRNGKVTFLMTAYDPAGNLVSDYACSALIAFKNSK